MADRNTNGLWAVTSYFNPLGYQRRLSNYHIFRQRLGVPLITVEWSWTPGAGFQLRDADADVLIQVSGPDLLFQKERLLNLAVAALPDRCRYVAWVDCDVLFEDAGWPDAVIAGLQRDRVVQLFSESIDLPPDAAAIGGEGILTRLGVVEAIDRQSPEQVLTGQTLTVGGVSPGFAWASDAELVRRHGFYDACPLGSGDRVLVNAAYGQFAAVLSALWMGAAWSDHYLRWARPYSADVGGRVGCLPGRVYHLWHGALHRRQYRDRYDEFQRFGFDPGSDLTLDDQGVWRWVGNKPDIRGYVQAYFASRKEDG